jgi:hypothetical protein
MTLERTIPEMVGESDAAIGAFEDKAAIRAQDKIGKTSPV